MIEITTPDGLKKVAERDKNCPFDKGDIITAESDSSMWYNKKVEVMGFEPTPKKVWARIKGENICRWCEYDETYIKVLKQVNKGLRIE